MYIFFNSTKQAGDVDWQIFINCFSYYLNGQSQNFNMLRSLIQWVYGHRCLVLSKQKPLLLLFYFYFFLVQSRTVMKRENFVHQSITWATCLRSLQSVESWWPSLALTCTLIHFLDKPFCHVSEVTDVGNKEESPVLWVYCCLNATC